MLSVRPGGAGPHCVSLARAGSVMRTESSQMQTTRILIGVQAIAVLFGVVSTGIYFAFIADFVYQTFGKELTVLFSPLACGVLGLIVGKFLSSRQISQSQLSFRLAIFSAAGSVLSVSWVLFAMSMPH
jgi:hypothetical protein